MTIALNKFQKELCNIIQEPLPLRPAPFADIAERLSSDEATVISQLQELKSLGIIRRFNGTINYRALGKVAALVTAHIPENDLTAAIAVINALPGVSHNYLREHKYNLWFTLQADSIEQIENLLANLSRRLGCRFHSMPATKVFKLYVRFDADFPEKVSALPDVETDTYDVGTLNSEPTNLTSLEKDILTKLQEDLEISHRPFDCLATDTITVEAAIEAIQSLIDKGVIRAPSAILNHHKLGFDANVMLCAKVPPERIDNVGKRLAQLKIVSHCYERKTFQGWPYNLFAMMHVRTPEQIRLVTDQFTAAEQIDEFELLFTTAELKKEPVKQYFA